MLRNCRLRVGASTPIQLLIPVLLALAWLLISSPAGATPLLPGGNVPLSPFSGAPGVLLTSVSHPFVSALGPGDFSGTAIEAVYRDSVTGFLDFLYQFSSDPTSGLPIEQSTDGSYAGFTTDVQFNTGGAFGPFLVAGTVLAADATRSGGAGVNVSFDFPIPSAVNPGATTVIRMIKTNATNFGPGTVAFINQGTVTDTRFLAPAAAIPEPTYLPFAGGALLLFAGIRSLRRSV